MNKTRCSRLQEAMLQNRYIQKRMLQNLFDLHVHAKKVLECDDSDMDNMPARNLRKNYRALTGLISDMEKKKVTPFESSLERDFIYLLVGNREIVDYRWQPAKVEYVHDGKDSECFPDFAVAFGKKSIQRKDWIVEIKYRKELKEKWDEPKPKFRASTKYAYDRGMVFKVITDKEIRTDYLKNMRFLINFMMIETSEEQWGPFVDELKELRECTPRQLMAVVGGDKEQQAAMLPHLWYLVVHQVIATDLSVPLNMNSSLWLPSPDELTPELCQRIYAYRRG